MNFIVSIARIPGGIFATIFLDRFSRRPLFLTSALLVIVSHITMGFTYLKIFPAVCAMVAIALTQFAYTAGYISVAGLLLGSLLPSSSRSMFAGIIMTVESISALSQGSVTPYIVDAFGEAGLFFIFAGVVTLCLVYMFFLMPETMGRSLEDIEHIFLSPKQKGCNIRRDPKQVIAQVVNMFLSLVSLVNMIGASRIIHRSKTRRFKVAASAVLVTN